MKVYPPGTRIAGQCEVASRPLMGGMGIVYICYDHKEDRPVALKTFKPEYLPDRAARDRFLREGTHWVDLGAHPHVVRCYRVVRVGDGTEVYLALELVVKEQGRDARLAHAELTAAAGDGVALRPADRARHASRRRDHPRLCPPRPQARECPRRRRSSLTDLHQSSSRHRLWLGKCAARCRHSNFPSLGYF